MATYYTADTNGRITAFSAIEFSAECKQTTESIVLGCDGYYYFEGAEPHKEIPFAEVYAAKYEEIINGANAVKAALSRKYSDIEEQTWPQQEAGARAILQENEGLETQCKDETARAILKDEEGRKVAKGLVERLAEAGNTTPKEFAQRIINNADTAYNAGIQTLLEQQAYETALKAVEMSGDVGQVEAIAVEYSMVGGYGEAGG